MVKRVTYEHLPQIAGPYVHATKHNRTLYVSGLTAYGTHCQAQDFEAQTNIILKQISEILKVEKRNVSDLVKLTIFVKDITKLPAIRTMLFEFYGKYLPSCSLVEVSNLIHSELEIEIEAIVALESSTSR
ncbi:RidA family protein [Aliivibrio fischeri]|uniref:RidA family protein n=1 Tax=Aliivibrio fischeri TaxID=668 RepID=UPI00090816B3|nr:RidA family protein [Aliivibrio fischeri]